MKHFTDKILRKLKIRNRSVQYNPVSKDFLNSKEYQGHMARHLPYPGIYDLHEAQNETKNFLYRHHEVNHLLGVFRWRGIQKHKDLIFNSPGPIPSMGEIFPPST